MGQSIRLYFHYLSLALRSSMQYKMSFFLVVAGRFLASFNAILGVYFIFMRFHKVKGYGFGEVLLCFAIIQMSFALCESVSHGFAVFSGIVRSGQFDRILLRPRGAILQLLGAEFDVSRFGMLLQGIIMFIYGIVVSPVEWTALRILTVISMVCGGTVLFVSIFLLEAAISFFTLEGLEAVNILSYGAKEHGKYPVDIYGKGMMKFCTYVIPYDLVQYYPLQYLLGRTERWYYSLYPLGTLLFALFCYGLWRLGISRYQSAGS